LTERGGGIGATPLGRRGAADDSEPNAAHE
jgi:hypothetical protein